MPLIALKRSEAVRLLIAQQGSSHGAGWERIALRCAQDHISALKFLPRGVCRAAKGMLLDMQNPVQKTWVDNL